MKDIKDCYCVCHSPVSSCPSCEHCEDIVKQLSVVQSLFWALKEHPELFEYEGKYGFIFDKHTLERQYESLLDRYQEMTRPLSSE